MLLLKTSFLYYLSFKNLASKSESIFKEENFATFFFFFGCILIYLKYFLLSLAFFGHGVVVLFLIRVYETLEQLFFFF